MWTSMTIIFVIICGSVVESQVCDSRKIAELKNRSHTNDLKLEENEYLVDNMTVAERECLCFKGVCARKCCQFGMAYNADMKQCVNISDKFDPPVWENSKLKKGFDINRKFIFMIGKMVCARDVGERRLPLHPAAHAFYLSTDGKLYVEIPSSIPNVFIYGPDKYCIDTFVSEDAKPHLNALICFVTKPERNSYGLSSSCMLISCFFILLTLAVYMWLPELRNLHGLVLMVYLLCFFVGFLFLATMQILILRKEITQVLCIVLTFIVYFSLLSAFFWLNVMCYDIWWTFSGKRAHGHSESPHKRFIYYAAYAFGVPTALTILLGALEFSDLPIQHPLLPKLRLQGCFLYGNSKLLYLYGPILILCLANMTFFGLTAYKIWKIKKETKMLRGVESSTHDQDRKETQRFTLYVKLFTVMGINWILEVVSSFYPDADFYWQFSDAYNVLVGLIIFIIFVCKKKTWRMIKKRYKQLKGEPMSRTQTTTSTSTRTHSMSRDELPMNSIKK